MQDFIVSTFNDNPNHACTYYRQSVPMRSLSDLSLCKTYEITPDDTKDEKYLPIAAHLKAFSDILLAWSPSVEIRRAKTPITTDTGTLYPAARISDFDDNVDFVRPFNSAFAQTGTRSYPDGKLLEIGDTLEYDDAEGNRVTFLDDNLHSMAGMQFSIKNNLIKMKVRHHIIKNSDGITCCSPDLVRYHQKVLKHDNVYFYPNTVIPEDYEYLDVRRKNPDEVRILWQGGSSHYADLLSIGDALATVAKKYAGKVKFVFYGQVFPFITNHIPAEMIEYYPWSPYMVYKHKRGALSVDINLCPLIDDVFNRCKSAIKWYEASIYEVPEATLAANVGPYKEITDGENGMLYDSEEEFIQKLSLLIENADLRKRLANNARQWVLDNRTPEKTAPGLLEFYKETRERQKKNMGYSPLTVYSFAELDSYTKGLSKETR